MFLPYEQIAAALGVQCPYCGWWNYQGLYGPKHRPASLYFEACILTPPKEAQ